MGLFLPFYRRSRVLLSLAFAALVLLTLAACSSAGPTSTPGATPTPVGTPIATPLPGTQLGAPVIVHGTTLFYVRQRVGSISPSERAEIISRRIEAIANNPLRTELQVTAVDTAEGTDVLIDNDLVLTVTDLDAQAYGMSRQEIAARVVAILQDELIKIRSEISVENQVRGILQTLLLIAVLIALLWLVNRVYHRTARATDQFFARQIERAKEGEAVRWASQPLRALMLFLLAAARLFVWLLLLLVLLPLVLAFFPQTRQLFDQLVDLVREPLVALWEGFLTILPNLFFILVVAFLAWLVIRLVRAFFGQIERGTIRLASFDPEWAPLTKNLLTVLLIVLAVIVAFPYVPGADSPALQGISLFLGLLITLASTSAISNIIAGIILTYTGAFHMNDLVECANTRGFVVEKRLLTTRLRTFKNEEVAFPNSVILGAAITNYSALAKSKGLIIHTEVTIGYDAPWRTVHQLLIEAALATPGVLADPAPFVLQQSLNDWHISYQINAYTQEVEKLPALMSVLMQNIQDKFNAAGVEIMSPSFFALRDGNTVTIPAEARPADYQAPRFRIGIKSAK